MSVELTVPEVDMLRSSLRRSTEALKRSPEWHNLYEKVSKIKPGESIGLAQEVLPRGSTVLSRDDRPIVGVSFAGAGKRVHAVGQHGITKIVAYDERGIGSVQPWVAVYVGDQIVCRIPWTAVLSVGYQRAGEDEDGRSEANR